MCYDIKVSLERQLKVARNFGDKASIEEIEKKLMPYLNPIEREYYRVSGFDHPKLFLLDSEGKIKLAQWGIVPSWVKDKTDANKIQNMTLNGRVEELEDKPSFRDAYRTRRGILFVDGFYEYHHHQKKTFPYYVKHADASFLALACLYEEKNNFSQLPTFTILTRRADTLMSEIHNNPNLPEPRMPMIIEENMISSWLDTKTEGSEFVTTECKLEAHTVRRFAGRANNGNLPDSCEEFFYPELSQNLFD